MLETVAGVSAALAAVPALLFLANLRLYRAPAAAGGVASAPRAERETRSTTRGADATPLAVSVLIPARNEEASIVAAVEAALASQGVTLEVVVLDDHSEDATARLVGEIAARDPRVRLLTAPPLPEGWCGKQHACHVLAGGAAHPVLAFLDADVRLAPDGLARMGGFLRGSGADLVSGFPHQETGTLGEKLVIPLIHFVLLGFLPVARMRRSTLPAYAAGCGQLFVTWRPAYDAVGGHAAIRATLHDGIKLPRAYRAAGRMTDVCDATDVAACRMYRGFGELWRGLAKNATEGLAAPAMIVPATLLLLGGQVLPLALLAFAAWLPPAALALAAAGTALAYLPRFAGVVRFRQSVLGAVLHPVGVLTLLAIQWYAFVRSRTGRPATWKGRSYPQAAAPCG